MVSSLTTESLADSIYQNLLSSIIQDIISRQTVKKKLLQLQFPDATPYYSDPSGTLDIHGNAKQADSALYVECNVCGREVSGNRFAAHLVRCLSRGKR
ncbi:unnamed protein product [Kluyveromyces dobzhanskii CBS 2104]|uniref:SAGA-associated factor 11 n=1 Tax=Kluyveromyces dobzhanskii CBS 2104 TaxID=1427455 RepID=A0A0A8L6R4_9SACH|nr:unnamed protein product [Kluyveromyces dobzhanskii CBS 2104]